jgi:hypothetical protein
MGLINLKTDLKSLKYGYDRPGGGSSNQPYIVTPIPDGLTANGPDFLLRQGALRSSITDIERLTKFFTDTTSVRGLLFTAKQELLERQNPKMVNTNRIYLPTNTINQAGAVAIGTHFNKQGLDPASPLSYFAGGEDGYYFATKGVGAYPASLNGVKNRLTTAYTIKIANQPQSNIFGITNPDNPGILLSYPGGPNAPLGLGTTNIRIQNPTIKLKDVYTDGEDRAEAIYKNLNIVSILPGSNQLFLSHKEPVWIYNPTQQGASFQYESLDNVSPDEVYVPLFTDNISNILNRETFLPLPPNKDQSTFIRNSGYLGSPDKYLIPAEVNTANIVWSYNLQQAVISRYAGASDAYFKTYGTPSDYKSILFSSSSLTRRDRTLPFIYKDSDTFDRGSGVLEDDPNYLVPSNVNLANVNWSYNPTKQGASHEFKLKKPKEANSNLLFKDDYKVDILNRKQDIPSIQTFSSQDKTITQEGTTALASLNPHYNIAARNSDGRVVRVPAPYPDIKEFNREDTYKAMPTVYRSSRTKISNSTIKSDRLNETDIIQSSTASLDNISLPNVDLAKFFFEINNNNGNSSQNWFLYFRAYLNDLSDNFNAEWQSYKYVGRAENFYRYSGFTREMSLSFTVYAHSRAEMVPLYNKLNYLAGSTAPDYSDEGYLRGNFTYITVGDYINNMPSIIKSVSLKPSFDAGWDINRKLDGTPFSSTDGISNVGQVPRLIETTINFTPLHKFTPQFKKNFINDVNRSGPSPEPEKEFTPPNLIDSSGGTIEPSGGNAL